MLFAMAWSARARPMEQHMLCRLLDIGCGSTTPIVEFAVIGAAVALVITFLMRGSS